MEKTEEQVRVHLTIEGRVQGVFFRASARHEAVRLGLRGWVRNCPAGAVEVVAEGARKEVETLIAWCRQGPPGAQVRDVRVEWEPCKSEFRDFRITR